ncbi:MAG: BREX-6 system adenine-specific DNA-methyltransferase PglX, partial [Planctomycetota bacterium]
MANSKWYERNYEIAKTDLFAGMTVRALELLRPSGTTAMIALSSWMFIKSFAEFREHVLSFDLQKLADFGKAAFSTGGTLISTACYVVRKTKPIDCESVALRPMAPTEIQRDSKQPRRTEAALAIQRGRHDFLPSALELIPEKPVVYWWKQEISLYAKYPLMDEHSPARATQGLYNNTRFIRRSFELSRSQIRFQANASDCEPAWVPLTNGSNGVSWVEPLREVALWGAHGIQAKSYMSVKVKAETYRYANEQFFFLPGAVAFASIGSGFSARVSKYVGLFANMGRSVFSDDPEEMVCRLNSTTARALMRGLNPGIHFEAGDVNRIPLFPIDRAQDIFQVVLNAFEAGESHREPSVEFIRPAASPYRYAQEWAQAAVDRAEGEPLPEYIEELEPEPPTDHLSFSLGVALGRFGADGQGMLDPTSDSLDHALPAGILFLDGTLDDDEEGDGLSHAASAMLQATWAKYGSEIKKNRSLRQWLSLDFFKDVHKGMYENRPIYWPLSSAKKTFVAWVNIHRMNNRTLTVLLADHLQPTLTRLDGELNDLTEARSNPDRKAAREADDRYADVKAWRDELADFIANVNQCSQSGPAPADPRKPEREVEAVFDPVLDDGVMINSSALWPLLEPQWKDPKKWWKELVAAKGKKDYDWSHLAMRYWPRRVDKKCQSDPSLGVAHGCFWKYHPARAWAWELRLQDEIEQHFRIR